MAATPEDAAVAVTPGKPRGVRIVVAFLIVGTAIAVAGAFVPSASTYSQWVPLLTVVAIGYGVLRYRPASTVPWIMMAAGTSSTALAGFWSASAGGRPPFPSVPDGLDAGMYLLLGLALVTWAKPAAGRSRWEGAVDAGVVTASAIVTSWTFIVDPMLGIDGLAGMDLVGALVFPILDLLILTLIARTLFFVGMHTMATVLTMLGLISLLVADSASFVVQVHGYDGYGNPAINVGWAMTAVFLGAAALHPSMAETGRHVDTGSAVVCRGRIRMYVALTFFIPALTIGGVLVGENPGAAAYRLIVPLLASATMSALLLLRLNQLTVVMHRRAAELNDRSVALADALREQGALQDELRRQALHDPLTSLGNRALLREQMDHTLARAPLGEVHGLMLLDLDGFKDVNDTLGHPAGDELLLEVAHRLRAATPVSATLVRLGGDEFAILVPDTARDELTRLSEAVLVATRAPYLLCGQRRTLTTSLGVRVVTGPDNPMEVMRHADIALYAAKAAGKNQIAVYADAVLAGSTLG